MPAESSVVSASHAAIGYGATPVLTDLEFEIPRGSRVALLGPNGGGKTTLFRALLGELETVAGSIEVAVNTALASVGREALADPGFGDLSGGQRQRVLIARALTADADLLLLDEPFTGLDNQNEERLSLLIDQLAAEGRTVMIATHEVEQAAAWDLVLCLNESQIAFGKPDSVLTKPVLEATYGGHIVELPGQPELTVLPSHHHDHEGRH